MSSHPGSSHSTSYAANAQPSEISNPQGSTPFQALPLGVHHSGHSFHGHGGDDAFHPSFLGAVASGGPQYHAATSHNSVFDLSVVNQPLNLEIAPRYPLQGDDYIHSQSSSGGFDQQTLTGVGQLPHAGPQEIPMRYQRAAADPPMPSSAEENSDTPRPKRVVSKPRDTGPEPASKKRSLDESAGGDETAEGKKRARGRPRLNPKDQTATEVCQTFFFSLPIPPCSRSCEHAGLETRPRDVVAPTSPHPSHPP